MKDDNNRKNLTEPFDDGMADDLQDALTQADDVIGKHTGGFRSACISRS